MGNKYNQFFKEMEKISRIRFPRYKYINISNLIGVKIFILTNKSVSINLLIRKFKQNIFMRREVRIVKSNFDEGRETILFKRTHLNRKDYRFIENSTIEAISQKYNVIIMEPGKKKFDPYFIISILYLMYLFSVFMFKRVKNAFALSLEASWGAKNIKRYREILSLETYKSVITFCDIHMNDYLLMQLAKSISIDTLTLQHGMYNYDSIACDDMNALHCILSLSDKNMVWGNYSKDQFIKAGKSSEQIYLTGNPKVGIRNFINENMNNSDEFLVVFDHPGYTFSNINMLKIANQISENMNYKYRIRLHPNNCIEDYRDIINSNCIEILEQEVAFDHLINRYNFALCHNTAMYFELTQLGLIIYRYRDTYFSDIDCFEKNKFSDISEFILKYRLNSHDDTYIQELRNLSSYYFYQGEYSKSVLNAIESNVAGGLCENKN